MKATHSDGYGRRTGECGDSVEMYLFIANGRIRTGESRGWIRQQICAPGNIGIRKHSWSTIHAVQIE